MEKNCLFMHEGVLVTQTSDIVCFQGELLIPEELKNCKVKNKLLFSLCAIRRFFFFFFEFQE